MSKKAFLLYISAVAIIFGIVGFALLSRSSPQVTINNNIIPILPTPTPIPFYQLTIPYLRQRNYQSSMVVNEKVSENNTYTSYFVSYDSDGLRINGLLTVPIGIAPSGGWPAIIFVHGYIPPSEYQTLVDYSSYVDFLARAGFVVFKIDLRGHANSQGEPGGAYYSSDYIIDTLNAYAALQSSNSNLIKIDPEKIGLWGHSMAGNVVFRSFVIGQNIPAIVIWAGAVYSYEDWQKYGISDRSYQPPPEDTRVRRHRQELFDVHGQFNANSPFWKQVVPTNYLEGIRGGVQINHAVNDNVVSIEYSKDLMNILDNTSIPHELHEYQSGGHNLTGSSFNQAMRNTVDFFKAYLGR
ncbi:alpha/beta hydrolase [Candidatus Roizmanbacteria bacterium]|nr:alpha/beta hydrolase [Candidatus Roizmanbacteria bacterium]